MKNMDMINEPKRCDWCGTDSLYVKYHDEEWGKLVTDDDKMFEFLVLESAQAGLSWYTILKRRENYREAFAQFNANKVAAYTPDDVERLMQDTGIIRNRRKIESTITNARLFLDIQRQFGSFCDYLWEFFPDKKPIVNHWNNIAEIPATSAVSDAISKDMKKRGFRFFGSTICYAHLQAVGYIDDHIADCHCRTKEGI